MSDNENSYFLVLTEDEKQTLRNQQIHFMDYPMDGENGIIIDHSKWNEVRRLLDYNNFNEMDTTVNALIKIVKYDPTSTTKNIEFENFPRRSNVAKAWREDALNNFAEFLDKDIRVLYRGGDFNELPAARDNRFHIFIHSSKGRPGQYGNRLLSGPHASSSWGIMHEHGQSSNKCQNASGEGIPIVDDNQYTIAELFPNALYLHTCLCAQGTHSEIQLLNKILDEVQKLYPTHIEKKKIISKFSVPVFNRLTWLNEVVSREILPLAETNVLVIDGSDTRTTRQYITDPNLFSVYIGYAKNYKGRETVPQEIFGCATIRQNYLVITENSGFPISDDNGTIVAEMTGNVVNILVAGLGGSQRKLFEKICQKVAEFIKTSPDDREEMMKKHLESIEHKSQENFVKILMKTQVKILDKAKADLESCQRKARDHQQKLALEIRTAQTLQSNLSKMESDDGGVKERVEKEMRTLSLNKNIIKTYVMGNKMIILTKNIYCEDPRSKIIHDIGIFNIFLKLDPEESGYIVTFFNLKHTVSGMSERQQAPHVFEHGDPCLGSISETLPQLIGSGEYAVAADLCIQFLQSVNVDDSAGRHIHNWPIYYDPSKDKKKPKEDEVASEIVLNPNPPNEKDLDRQTRYREDASRDAQSPDGGEYHEDEDEDEFDEEDENADAQLFN